MRFENEKELEDMLHDYHKDTGMCRVLEEHYDYMLRQFVLPGYGIIDLLGLHVYVDGGFANVKITIYELKQHNIVPADVAQISRYYAGIKRYLQNVYNVRGNIESGGGYHLNRGIGIFLEGCIVGSGYSDRDTCFLIDNIPWLECYHFNVGFDGIEFKASHGWYDARETKEKIVIDDVDIDNEILLAFKEAKREEREFRKSTIASVK